MNTRFFDWIWHIRGSLPLPPGQSNEEAFARLDPFFRERGTSYKRSGNTLTFRKQNQAPQDKMSIFDGGVLQIEYSTKGPVLRYNLFSRALLYCFLAPLLFLSFAQITIALNTLEKTPAETSEKSKKEKKQEDRVLPQHPIDKALGAPAPEQPKKDDKEKDEEKGPSPTPAYVFAAIFAALYAGGRILEAWLIKSRFRKNLYGSPISAPEAPLAK